MNIIFKYFYVVRGCNPRVPLCSLAHCVDNKRSVNGEEIFYTQHSEKTGHLTVLRWSGQQWSVPY